jgi:cobalt-precorrin 5A hydrolase
MSDPAANHAPQIIVGVGCRTSATVSDIEVLIRTVLQSYGLYGAIHLAAPQFKIEGRAPLDEAAARLTASLEWISDDQLAEVAPRCLSEMKHDMPGVGKASVAEACALAAGGTNALLLGPRQLSEHVSCAIAQIRGTPS